jgi:scyllo-inositol 2-dehydrogenase (NADP+)
MIEVGLVGFGFAGRTFHAPVISAVEGLRLTAIVQRRGEEAAAAYPSARIVRSVEELLAQEDINLVVIATPNTSHFELARLCLEQGRDVVIDKPFATDYSEAVELSRLAKSKGRRVLSVYQNRRWDGDFATLQQLIKDQSLGRLVLFESHFDRFRPKVRPEAWRERNEPGSGVLFDLGVHLIDQAMVVFGIPQAVTADVRAERDGAVVDDAFDVTLHYEGLRALLRASMLARAAGPRFLLHGTSGSYVKYGLDPQEDALKRGEKPGGSSWGVESEDKWGMLLLGEEKPGGGAIADRRIPTLAGDYRKFYENVRDAIEGRASLSVTPEQALNVLWALHLAQESSAKGCTIAWRKPGERG